MYKAVIFDLDGTLLDTLDDLKNSVNFAMRECGFPERGIEEVRRFVGNGVKKLIDRAVPDGTSAEAAAAALDSFKAHYAVHCEDMTAPYPGIIEMLDALRAEGVKTAVVSNKIDSAAKKLCKKYFGDRLMCTVGDIDGRKKKPSPDPIYAALDELGVRAEDSVYIGDSDVDVLTAKNCNMDCIGVSWGFRSREVLEAAGAVRIAADSSELLEMLRAKSGIDEEALSKAAEWCNNGFTKTKTNKIEGI